MPDYGVKFPIVVPLGEKFKKNGIVYEIKAQTIQRVNKKYGYRKNGMGTSWIFWRKYRWMGNCWQKKV